MPTVYQYLLQAADADSLANDHFMKQMLLSKVPSYATVSVAAVIDQLDQQLVAWSCLLFRG